MIQPSIERTATAPVDVRASLVAGGPVPLVGDLGDGTGSMSISVEAIVGIMTELTCFTSRKPAALVCGCWCFAIFALRDYFLSEVMDQSGLVKITLLF